MSHDRRMVLTDSEIGQAVAHVTLICPSQRLWVGADEVAERWLPLWRAELAKRKATTAPERPADRQWPGELEVPRGLSFTQWLKVTARKESTVSTPAARELMRRTLAHLAEQEGDEG